jgi:hypothetical protein
MEEERLKGEQAALEQAKSLKAQLEGMEEQDKAESEIRAAAKEEKRQKGEAKTSAKRAADLALIPGEYRNGSTNGNLNIKMKDDQTILFTINNTLGTATCSLPQNEAQLDYRNRKFNASFQQDRCSFDISFSEIKKGGSSKFVASVGTVKGCSQFCEKGGTFLGSYWRTEQK